MQTRCLRRSSLRERTDSRSSSSPLRIGRSRPQKQREPDFSSSLFDSDFKISLRYALSAVVGPARAVLRAVYDPLATTLVRVRLRIAASR